MSSVVLKISTHVLDTNKGSPVANLPVKLYKQKKEDEWILIYEGVTASTGRLEYSITEGSGSILSTYKFNFAVRKYYESINAKTIYPYIDIIFDVHKLEHYHMPLLLNAFGFTTYRGS